MSARQETDLESRIRAIEDHLAIQQVLATYGPAVDSLSEGAVSELWADGGVYDAGGSAPFVGSAEVGALVRQEPHTSYVEAGCAHVLSLPVIRVDGDRATAHHHSRVYRHNGTTWDVVRVSANQWDLVREASGWRVLSRVNRLLDGSAEAREILAAGVAHD